MRFKCFHNCVVRYARLYVMTCRKQAEDSLNSQSPKLLSPSDMYPFTACNNIYLKRRAGQPTSIALYARPSCDACRGLPVMAISDFFQTALQRLGVSASTVPTAADWAQVSLIIGATCAISLPIGLKTSKLTSPCAKPE